MTFISKFDFKLDTLSEIISDELLIKDISVIIPVKDNQKGIDSYLITFFNCIREDNFPYEIIVIDNNSIKPIVINAQFLNKQVDIKLIQCNKIGPAAARNAGAAVARGKWLLFNDSDCLPDVTLFQGYLTAYNRSIAYAGNVKSFGNDLLSKYYESQEILIPPRTKTNDKYTPQYIITANALIFKAAFETIGGFNEDIKIAGGEDIDIGLRLSQVGNLSYALNSIVYHNFNDRFIGFIKRFRRYGKGNRQIERIWGVSMKPVLFPPNSPTIFNHMMAKAQYFFLLFGYFSRSS